MHKSGILILRVFHECQKKLDWGLCKHHLPNLIRSFPHSVHKKCVGAWKLLGGITEADCLKTPWLRMGENGTTCELCQPMVCLNYRLLKLSSSEIWSDCTPAASSQSEKSGETWLLGRVQSAGQWPLLEGKLWMQMSLVLYLVLSWHTYFKTLGIPWKLNELRLNIHLLQISLSLVASILHCFALAE